MFQYVLIKRTVVYISICSAMISASCATSSSREPYPDITSQNLTTTDSLGFPDVHAELKYYKEHCLLLKMIIKLQRMERMNILESDTNHKVIPLTRNANMSQSKTMSKSNAKLRGRLSKIPEKQDEVNEENEGTKRSSNRENTKSSAWKILLMKMSCCCSR